jgi:hypothetical protein
MKTKSEVLSDMGIHFELSSYEEISENDVHNAMRIWADQQLEEYKKKLKEAIEEKQMVHWSSQAYNGMQVAKDLIDTVN